MVETVVVKRSMRGRAHSEDSNLIVLPAQAIVDMVAETKLPRQNWSCSDDASGTALTLARQRTYIVNAIKKLFHDTVGTTTTLEYENQRLRKALKAVRPLVATNGETEQAQAALLLIDEALA